jgi:hypothetical protein
VSLSNSPAPGECLARGYTCVTFHVLLNYTLELLRDDVSTVLNWVYKVKEQDVV